MRACSPSPITCPEIKPQTVKIDTIWIKGDDSIVYRPKPYKVYLPSDTVYIDVDTLAILKDYFSKVVYQDTIKLDTIGYLLVRDTISQNRIQNRKVIENYQIPIVTKTVTNNVIIPAKTQLYIGFEVAGNKKNPINYFGPNLTLKTKKDQLYSLGTGLSTEGINYKIGTSWKIKLKKE